ncbi:MAG: heavy-metal-associated domain-containing protein [Nitrospirales bacterium]|nr:heavy-metal-associated domain-containing protein [Nitrospirales bacterium]
MGKVSLHVQKEFCGECTLALTRFITKMPGVSSVDVEEGRVTVEFDDAKTRGGDILRITKESIEKLGYRTVDK